MSVPVSLLNGFSYDSKGYLSGISKNGQSIEAHEYSITPNSNSNTVTSKYPSSASPLYTETSTTDKYGKITSISGKLTNTYDACPVYYDDGSLIVSTDNASSKPAISTDLMAGEKHKYIYNSKGLLQQIQTLNNSTSAEKRKETYTYDKRNRLLQNNIIYDVSNSKSVSSETNYVKSENDANADNVINKTTYQVNGTTVAITQNTYDNFKRISGKTYTLGALGLNKTITYDKTRISSIELLKNGTAVSSSAYSYDALGRISGISQNVSGTVKSAQYTFDSYGQLVRENNAAKNKTILYTYDNIGNITSAKSYAYTTDATPSGTFTEDVYTYGGTANYDILTKFNNKAIVYNTMGCPISYNGNSYTWSKGKLSRVSNTDLLGVHRYSFTYNGYGQRSSVSYSFISNGGIGPPIIWQSTENETRAISTTGYTKNFYYDNCGRLVAQKQTNVGDTTGSSTKEIQFLYDEASMIGMVYTIGGVSNEYLFNRNLQGDVTEIYDTSGSIVVQYFYDAWGNCTYSGDAVLAKANPIRYRGYYYDEETGLYYLNSRYYNPVWRRFISPDSTSYIDPKTANGLNLYAYCGNDPVNYADPSGHLGLSILIAFLAITTISGAISGGIIADKNDKSVFGGIMLGASLGLAGGGLILAAAGAFMTVFQVTLSGVTTLQTFAVGALAYNLATIVALPFFGIEMEPIDYSNNTYQIPYIPQSSRYSPPPAKLPYPYYPPYR